MNSEITTEKLVNILHGGEDVAEKFSGAFPEAVLDFSKLIVKSHQKYNLFQAEKAPDKRQLYTGAFVYLTLDSLFTSMHLLMMGYLTPSGNMFRQGIEALSMAALLSEKQNIKVVVKKGWVQRDFLNDFLNKQKYTESHNAQKWLAKNALQMRLKQSGLDVFEKGKRFYNSYSHPSLFSLASRMKGGENPGFLIGNIYDEDKQEFYKKELENRISFVINMPETVEYLYKRTKNA